MQVKKIASKLPSKAKLIFCTMIVLAIFTFIATEVHAESFIGSQEASGSTYNYPGTKAMGMVVEVTDPVSINEMYAHVYNVGNSTLIRGIIYKETEGDWDVVAYSDAVDIVEGWNHISLPYTVELTIGRYLLAHITDGTRVMYYSGSGGGRVWNTDVDFDSPDASQPVQLAYHYGAWAPIVGEETPAAPEPTPQPTEPFRAQYLFNGNANDTGGKGYHGETFNVTLVEDRLGNPDSAFEFNGSNSHVKIPFGDEFSLLNNYSISVWVLPYQDSHDSREAPIVWKMVSEGNNDDVYSIGYGFGYGEGFDNQPRFVAGTEILGKDFVAASDIFESGHWYNVQVTRIGSEMIIEVYNLDGNILSRNIINVVGTPMRGPSPLMIGSLLNSDHGGVGCSDCAGVFYGVIDDIEFHNGALSEEERAALARTGIQEQPDTDSGDTAGNCQDVDFTETADMKKLDINDKQGTIHIQMNYSGGVLVGASDTLENVEVIVLVPVNGELIEVKAVANLNIHKNKARIKQWKESKKKDLKKKK